MIQDVVPLKADLATKWTRKNVPATEFFTDPDLVPALAYSLDLPERELHVLVRKQFQNESVFTQTTVKRWIEASNLIENQFLMYYSMVGCHVDGLFVWLATVVTCLHLNFVHANGIWSSRASEKLDMRDALVMHVEGHFLSAHSKNDQVPKEEVWDCFYDPLDTLLDFVPYPMVLNRLVNNLSRDVKKLA